jgi:thymidylate synthase (FAD)
MARVSAPENQDNLDTGAKLIGYLIKHKHWSPFEMANMCLEINTTRAISPQILRHRSFTFQEFSQRYATTEKLARPDMPHLRMQDHKNRQNSIDAIDSMLSDTQINDLLYKVATLQEESAELYKEMLDLGIAKECARSILPLNTPTRLYMNGTLRSWIHYIELRTSNGTQFEHREVASKCKSMFIGQFPIISQALGWN